MNWTTAHSLDEDFDQAWNEVRAHVQTELSTEPDLVIVFASADHARGWAQLARYVHASFPDAALFGGGARGTMAADLEFEGGASLTVLAATFRGGGFVEAVYLPEEKVAFDARLKEVCWGDVNGMLMLADPFSIDAEALLDRLDLLAPRASKVGGILSGGTRLGDHALWDVDGVYDEGALLLLFRGTLTIEPVVAQSATPIGEPLIIMRRRGYLIDEFNAGKPADVLKRALQDLESAPPSNVWENIVVGLDVGADQIINAPSDYLIRTVIGLDPVSGSLAVAAQLQNYQTLRFHLRDAESARVTLKSQLAEAERSVEPQAVRAAVAFNCVSRGVGFFGAPHEDARQIARLMPHQHVVGVFCSGEIGPVATKTYLHTLTTSVAIICERALN